MLSNQRVLGNPALQDHRSIKADEAGKVCLMIGQLGLGGTEKQVVLLARGLASGESTPAC